MQILPIIYLTIMQREQLMAVKNSLAKWGKCDKLLVALLPLIKLIT